MHSMVTMRMAVLASFGLAAASLLAGQSAKAKGNFDVRAFGAKGDGATMDTAAVQATLDACARAGGGRVTVPPGTYLIGSIYLGDRTELHLESGATLLGSPNLADYNAPDDYPQNWGSQKEGWSAKHLILALEKKGVSITGRGVIDGNGRAFFDDKPQFVGKVCWRDGGINARDYKHQGRPGQEIVFIECSDVEVREVTFRDMSCWSCFFHGCENVTVGGVTIRNGMRNLNTDGFDVDSCRNVRIGDCDIVTGDDAIAIRGSPARLKDQSKVCENVRVSNIVCRVSADGVRVGVGDGTIRDVRISDMRIEHAGRGLHVQCCYGKAPKKGVDISNIVFERISIREVSEAVAVVAGSELSKATLGGVRFVGIDAETCLPMTIAGGGATHVDGVEFENCTFRFVKSAYDSHSDHEMGTMSGRKNGAFYIEKASGLAFRSSRLFWQDGAMPSVTRAFSVHDAAEPSVDGLSRMPDRANVGEPSGAGEFSIDTPRATGGPVVRAVDFGFSPTNDKNAAAIMRALAECRRVKANRLELAPGTYRCFDEPGVVMRDFTDFTLDGKGAVLVFRRAPEYRCQPQSELILDKGNLLVQRCLRIEVRDLVMDWDWEGDPLASFVRVTRRNIDEAHPENAWMELTFVDYERHPKYPEPVPVQKLMAMDECRTRFRAGAGLSCGQTEGHFGAKNEWTAPNVLRVWPGMPMPERNQNPATRFAANPKWNLQVVRRFEEGGLYRLQHCYYGKNGINLDARRARVGVLRHGDGHRRRAGVLAGGASARGAAHGKRVRHRLSREALLRAAGVVHIGRPPRGALERALQVHRLLLDAQQRRLQQLPRPLHDRGEGGAAQPLRDQPPRGGLLPRRAGRADRAAPPRFLARGLHGEARAGEEGVAGTRPRHPRSKGTLLPRVGPHVRDGLGAVQGLHVRGQRLAQPLLAVEPHSRGLHVPPHAWRAVAAHR